MAVSKNAQRGSESRGLDQCTAEPDEGLTTPVGSGCFDLQANSVVIRLFGWFKFVDPLKISIDPRRNEFAI